MQNSVQSIAPEGTIAMNPDYSEVAVLAYQLWNDRGRPIGSPEEDWFQAEATLKSCDQAIAVRVIPDTHGKAPEEPSAGASDRPWPFPEVI